MKMLYAIEIKGPLLIVVPASCGKDFQPTAVFCCTDGPCRSQGKAVAFRSWLEISDYLP
jgi:hypothetical protein